MNRPNAILAVGMPGCGTSTLMMLMKRLLDPKHTCQHAVHMDMDDLYWPEAKEPPRNVLTYTKQHRTHLHAGYLPPDHMFLELAKIRLDHLRFSRPQIRVILGSGFPTTVGQMKALDMFGHSAIIHVTEAAAHQCHASIQEKMWHARPDQIRPIDRGGADVFETRVAEYQNRTLPVMRELNGSVITLKRSEPLRCRMKHLVKALLELKHPPVRREALEEALVLLKNDHSGVNADIHRIENPVRHTQRAVA